MLHFDSALTGAKTDYIRRFPAKNAVLDLDFINNRGYLSGVSSAAADLVTCTRNTTGTVIAESGNMQSVSTNTCRFDVNPETLSARGLCNDPTRTNLFLNALADKTVLSTQSVTVTAQAYTVSFFGTGSITFSGAYSGTLTGLGSTSPAILIFTLSAGTLTCTVSGSVFWAQLEAGYGRSSFIPTDASVKSRSADVIILNGTVSDWFNTSDWTTLVEYEIASEVRNTTSLSFSDGTFNNLISFVGGSSSGFGEYASVSTGGVSQGIFPGGTQTKAKIGKLYVSVFGGTGIFAVNDIISSSQFATGYTLPTVNKVALCGPTNSGQLCGWIRRVTYIPKSLSLSTLRAAIR